MGNEDEPRTVVEGFIRFHRTVPMMDLDESSLTSTLNKSSNLFQNEYDDKTVEQEDGGNDSDDDHCDFFFYEEDEENGSPRTSFSERLQNMKPLTSSPIPLINQPPEEVSIDDAHRPTTVVQEFRRSVSMMEIRELLAETSSILEDDMLSEAILNQQDRYKELINKDIAYSH